jgi:photosystem II stability/assembly factor-like uncharacterized protein
MFRALSLLTALLSAGLMAQSGAQRPAPESYSQLRWRYIGPTGNRVTSVAGVPGDPLVYYAGAASGGIFKTIDGGIHWQSIFDDQPVASLGSIAVAPSDPNVVWAGTGEPFIRSNISVGQGIYKSTDAGRTWTLAGLEKTGRIARIAIDPAHPDSVLACALGHAYGPQPERGVFRTTDGGRTWARTLFVDENTGCSDMAMDPKNPRVVFAGMWQVEIHTWGRDSGGPGSGLFVSRDGGATWKRLGPVLSDARPAAGLRASGVEGDGLPTKPVGRVAVAIAHSNPNRVYTMIETGDGVPWNGKETDRGQIWRSENGGETWRMINTDRNAMGRAHYYSRMAIATDNENETYYLTAAFSKSIDGGATLVAQAGAATPGGDNHDMWIDPTNGDRMAIANDGGVSLSVTRGRSWHRIQLPIAQMYHVTTDNEVPYNVYGNEQDDPSYRGPSNSRSGTMISRSVWNAVGGGESGWATPDPVDSNIVWSSASGSGTVGGIVVRYEQNRRQGRNVEVWPDQANGVPADLKYRFVWTMPLTMSPHDRNKIYVGSQHVHQTIDGGQSWQVISPDLTLNDKTRQQSSGGLTPDNIGVEYAGVVFAIAESRLEKGLIWAGTNDGLVQLTRDAGKTWTSLTANIPNLPPWGTVSNIEPSRFDASAAYITVDFHQVNNRDPIVYKTTDYGKTWKAITNGIPRSMLSYAHCVREDPVRRGLLYLGTENAVYVSFDDGENWQPLQNNLPHAPVYWLTVQEHFNDLVIATYGRGFWILDDLTPLQQMTPQVQASDAQLFPPRPAYRFRDITDQVSMNDDPTVGQNPPYGASISYYLKTPPAGPVTLAILDQKGQTIRTLSGTKQAGLNRVTWDLRNEPTPEVRLRTSPLYAPDVQVGPQGWRSGGGQMTLLSPPGNYTVKLTAAGRDFTQPLVVRKDPHSAGTEAEIQQQIKTLEELRRDVETTAGMVNQIEMIRSQLQSLTRIIEPGKEPDARKAADDLEQKLIAIEGTLVELRSTGRGQDGVRWGSKLLGKINYLATELASADHRPTSQQLEVQKILEGRIATSGGQLDTLLGKELAAFNDLLRRRNLPMVVVPGKSGS